MRSIHLKRSYSQNSRYLLLKLFTVAYLIFASSPANAAGDLCSGIFKATEATVSDVLPLTKMPEVKRTTRLDEEAQLLRRYILESGEIDTTKLRSEFKHYVESSRTDEMIRQLEIRFGPQFSIDGKQLSGIASRDGMVKLDTKDLNSSLKRVQMGIFTLGETVLGQARETLGTNSAKTIATNLISVNAIDGLRFSLDDVIQVIVPQEGDPTCGGGYQACPPSYGSGSPASDGPPSNIISKVTVTCEIDEIQQFRLWLEDHLQVTVFTDSSHLISDEAKFKSLLMKII